MMRWTQLGVLILCSFLVAACGSDPAPDDGLNVSIIPRGNPEGTPLPYADVYVNGDITADATWSGIIRMLGKTTIATGVTVNIAAGSEFYAVPATSLNVNGTLNVLGNAASPVAMTTSASGSRWSGIIVLTGAANVNYVNASEASAFLVCENLATGCDINNSTIDDVGYAAQYRGTGAIRYTTITQMGSGGINVLAGANLLIEDSTINTSSGDIFVANGGALSINYSDIGGAQYEHCNLHINALDSLTLTNSDIHDSVYGFMLGGTPIITITGNNFTNNSTTHIADYNNNGPGGDATGNYWDPTGGGAPTIVGLDTSGGVGTPIAGTGPRTPPSAAN